jgi:hypothetical protein
MTGQPAVADARPGHDAARRRHAAVDERDGHRVRRLTCRDEGNAGAGFDAYARNERTNQRCGRDGRERAFQDGVKVVSEALERTSQ